MPVLAALLLSALPAMAQDQLIFNAKPQKAFEAGTETVPGAAGPATFLHALIDPAAGIDAARSDEERRQGSELISWRPADAMKGKRIRFITRLKAMEVSRAGCSLSAWNDSRSLRDADGPTITGNADWADCSVVMVIPDNATRVQLRYYLLGKGKVWSDGFHVEQVGDDVPETRRVNPNLIHNGDER
jgi:hypothetical protein